MTIDWFAIPYVRSDDSRRAEYVSVTDLRAAGWTAARIKKLGPPDARGWTGIEAKLRLWLRSKVDNIAMSSAEA